MALDHDQYETLVEDALRSVVKTALEATAEEGLPAGRSLYVTFRTMADGVELPDYLIAKYPEEITVVLEHQFWDLQVESDGFAVTLAFNKKPERLVVPFSALLRFADPAVRFGVQFEGRRHGATAPGSGQEGDVATFETSSARSGHSGATDEPPVDGDAADDDAKVVAIDAFRKK
jgi:hypothetical protein